MKYKQVNFKRNVGTGLNIGSSYTNIYKQLRTQIDVKINNKIENKTCYSGTVCVPEYIEQLYAVLK